MPWAPCILHTVWSVSQPHGQWPAPMGSWRLFYHLRYYNMHVGVWHDQILVSSISCMILKMRWPSQDIVVRIWSWVDSNFAICLQKCRKKFKRHKKNVLYVIKLCNISTCQISDSLGSYKDHLHVMCSENDKNISQLARNPATLEVTRGQEIYSWYH